MMGKFPTLVLALALGPTVVGCATVPREAADLRKSAREALDQPPSEPRCIVGVAMNADLIVIPGPSAYQAGIRKGDRMRGMEGRPARNADDWHALARANYGRDKVTITVERDTEDRRVTLPCLDSAQVDEAHRQVLFAIANGEWRECISKIPELERYRGRDALTMRLRNNCSDVLRLIQRRAPTLQDAHLAYEARRILLEEAVLGGNIPNVKGEVLLAMQWLRSSGYSRFAEELEAQLAKAEGNRPETGREPGAAVRRVSAGSCFATNAGLVATAYHVVDQAKEVSVHFFGEARSRSARIRGSSKATDVAVLEVDGGPLPGTLSLVPPGGSRSGVRIFTVGYPVPDLLGEEPKFTEGVISGLSGLRGDAAFMQISVPVQPGNSGGPVVREDGLVVGVVSSSAAILPFIEETGSLPQDVNWAARAEYLRPLLPAFSSTKGLSSRDEAIEAARRAVCAVEAIR